MANIGDDFATIFDERASRPSGVRAVQQSVSARLFSAIAANA
jgi:hypothetical protein